MSLLYFLSLLLLISSVNVVKANNNSVVDTDGKSVKSRTFYWMFGGAGGGVRMGDTKNRSSCQTGVVLENNEVSRGMVVTILPSNEMKKEKNTIKVSSSVVLQFYPVFSVSSAGKSAWSYVWQVSPFDVESRQYFVNACAVEGSPIVSDVGSRFKIESSGNGYVLRLCTPFCRRCKPACSNVGIYDNNGTKRLALNSEPLIFKFQYAPIMF